MLIKKDKVEIVDFKTDRNPPEVEEELKPSYVLQISTYARLIQSIFPKSEVFSYLLWTKSRRLMPISIDLQIKHLRTFAVKEKTNRES